MAEVRGQEGLSQKEIGGALGVPWRSYQNYETGAREVSAEVLERMYTLYGADPAWLLCGDQVHRADADFGRLERAILAIEERAETLQASISPEKKASLIVKAYQRALGGDEAADSELDDWIEFAKH